MYNELRLAATLLREASEKFANHDCNDVSESFYKNWHPKYRELFVKDFHKWNGDEDEFDPEHLHIPDYALMDFLAFRLENKISADIHELQEDSIWLSYLETAGLDNWEGYDYAIDLKEKDEKEQ